MMHFRNILFPLVIFLIVNNSLSSQKLKKTELSANAKTQLENFEVLLNRYKSDGNHVQEAEFLNKIAYLYWENGSAEDAFDFFKQSLEINKTIGNENALQAIHTNIGTILFDNGHYEDALKYFNNSLELNRKSGKKRNVCGNLINVALSQGELNNYTSAIKILEEAYSIANELNDIKLMKTCLGMLYEYYDNAGNKGKSIEYYDKFTAIDKKLQQDEMNKMEQQTKQAQVEKIETEKILQQTTDNLKEVSEIAQNKEQENLNLKRQRELDLKDKELKELERKAEQRVYMTIFISFIIGIFLLVIIILIIFFTYKRNKRVNALLAKQNKEIRDQRDIIESVNNNIKNSINYAKRIQKALLTPVSDLQKLIPESFILFKPRDIVSGDFYWFSKTKIKSVISASSDTELEKYIRHLNEPIEDGIIIAAVDCTGHGVPGAFMSMIGYNLIHEIISHGVIKPEKILNLLNIGIRNQLKQKESDNRDGMDMAICLINKEKNILEYAGAKNPLIFIKNGELFQLKGDFLPIGGFFGEDEERNYTKNTVEIDTPTTFYIYSDGFSDQIGGEAGKKFLSKQFRGLLLEISSFPMDKQQEILKDRFNKWLGDEFDQLDDILIIGFKLYPTK